MPIAVNDLVMDVAITSFTDQQCEVLYSGPSYNPKNRDQYPQAPHVVRLHLSLLGETRPALSPLSVDMATDHEFRVYRYDWVFGIRSLTRWNWKSRMRDEALVIQLVLKPDGPNVGCTCIETKLNVLTPSRDTSSWRERNPDAVTGIIKGAATVAAGISGGAAATPLVESATKLVAALSNPLTSRSRWKKKLAYLSICRPRVSSGRVAYQKVRSRRVRTATPRFVDSGIPWGRTGRPIGGEWRLFAGEASLGVPTRIFSHQVL
jgi:hypothetical protein